MEQSPSELMRQKWRDIVETKRYNREEATKFFMSIYSAETDPIYPVNLAEAFDGVYLPDIRKPGEGLEDLWPHYFGLKELSEPDHLDYIPPSPLFVEEQAKFVSVARNIRKRADEINEETRKKCEQRSAARH